MGATSIVVEVVDGKVVAVYGNSDDVEVEVVVDWYELTDEQRDELEITIAQHPFVIYQANTR